MTSGPEGPAQLSARPWVRAGFSGPSPGTPSHLPSWGLDCAASADGFGPAPAIAHVTGSDKSPRPHPTAETACGATLGAAFYQGKSGSTEVNRVQVHFSNTCKLLSVTAKSKLLGEETPGFLCYFSPLLGSHAQPASQPFIFIIIF